MKLHPVLTIVSSVLVMWGTAAAWGQTFPSAPVAGEPCPSLVEIYRQNVNAVVFTTGFFINPEAKSETEFFNPPEGSKQEFTVGTGFLIHEDGYILTNTHTISRSIVPVIELVDGTRFDADIVAVMPQYDCAILKITSEKKLPFVQFEPQENLFVGEPVITIGCPHGLRYTMTYGILSGTNRSSAVSDIPGLVLHDLIQTDASINPGASGGPWFNQYGRIIGITVSKRSDSDNIGFGASLHTLHRILPVTFAKYLSQRFVLGFETMRQPEGAEFSCQITSVAQGSSAAQAGLQAGDIVHELNGTRVRNPLDLYLALLHCQPEETITLKVVRTQLPSTTSVMNTVMGTVSATEPVPTTIDCSIFLERPVFPASSETISQRLKMSVEPLTPELVKEFNLRTPLGVRVTSLDTAAYASLEHQPQVGDILARVNYIRPKDSEHLAEILRTTPENEPFNFVFLRVQTLDGKRTVTRIDIRGFRINP